MARKESLVFMRRFPSNLLHFVLHISQIIARIESHLYSSFMQVIRENLKKDIMVERIKQECWKDVAEAGLVSFLPSAVTIIILLLSLSSFHGKKCIGIFVMVFGRF